MGEGEIYSYVQQNVTPDGVVAITVCRNEFSRLPRWLDYYRSIGIKTFVIIDNGSTDSTGDYLRNQPDVHYLYTELSYGESKFGIDWVNAVRRALPDETWTLFVDLDEYIAYRSSPERSIDDLVATIRDNATAVYSFMVDMYPQGSFLDVDAGSNLLETCSYFDSEYHFRIRPQKPWDEKEDVFECVGGPRLRMMSTLAREKRSTWLDYMIRGQLSRVLKTAPKSWHRWIVEHYPPQPPFLTKIPLAVNRRAGHEIPYLSPHYMQRPQYAEETAVIMHYKFTADLRDKVDAEMLRREHFLYGAEYMAYKKFIMDKRNLNLYSEKVSRKFESSSTFDRLGFFSLKSRFGVKNKPAQVEAEMPPSPALPR